MGEGGKVERHRCKHLGAEGTEGMRCREGVSPRQRERHRNFFELISQIFALWCIVEASFQFS